MRCWWSPYCSDGHCCSRFMCTTTIPVNLRFLTDFASIWSPENYLWERKDNQTKISSCPDVICEPYIIKDLGPLSSTQEWMAQMFTKTRRHFQEWGQLTMWALTRWDVISSLKGIMSSTHPRIVTERKSEPKVPALKFLKDSLKYAQSLEGL